MIPLIPLTHPSIPTSPILLHDTLSVWEEKSLVAERSSYKQWGRLDSRPTERTLSLFPISSSPQSLLCHLRCVWLAGALAFDPAVAELGGG